MENGCCYIEMLVIYHNTFFILIIKDCIVSRVSEYYHTFQLINLRKILFWNRYFLDENWKLNHCSYHTCHELGKRVLLVTIRWLAGWYAGIRTACIWCCGRRWDREPHTEIYAHMSVYYNHALITHQSKTNDIVRIKKFTFPRVREQRCAIAPFHVESA